MLLDEKELKPESIIDDYIAGKINIICPSLIYFEVGNGLWSAVSKKRISETVAERLFRNFIELKIKIIDPNFIETIKNANKYKLSFYDSSYLTLAINLKAQLLTFDLELNKCFRKI